MFAFRKKNEKNHWIGTSAINKILLNDTFCMFTTKLCFLLPKIKPCSVCLNILHRLQCRPEWNQKIYLKYKTSFTQMFLNVSQTVWKVLCRYFKWNWSSSQNDAFKNKKPSSLWVSLEYFLKFKIQFSIFRFIFRVFINNKSRERE